MSMIRKIAGYIFPVVFFATAFIAYGQQGAAEMSDTTAAGRQRTAPSNAPVVTTRFIPDSIGIGDRFRLEVEITRDIMQIVEFPEFRDGQLSRIIEIVEEGPVDTVSKDGRKLKLRREYLLQTFEDGYYNLGKFPMLYVDKNIIDTLFSADSMIIKIGTYEIDTLTQTIYDIKTPLKTPLKFGEISGYIIWGLAGLGLLCVLIWYIFTKRRNLSLLGKPKPVEPPHVAAIKALETVHNQKLWQNNKHKLYYTRITDILREYIGRRYAIHAMEMTSDEIMEAMKARGLEIKSYEDLGEILKASDLVKFAKYIPEADFNETVFTNSYYFIEATKPTEIEPVTAEKIEDLE